MILVAKSLLLCGSFCGFAGGLENPAGRILHRLGHESLSAESHEVGSTGAKTSLPPPRPSGLDDEIWNLPPISDLQTVDLTYFPENEPYFPTFESSFFQNQKHHNSGLADDGEGLEAQATEFDKHAFHISRGKDFPVERSSHVAAMEFFKIAESKGSMLNPLPTDHDEDGLKKSKSLIFNEAGWDHYHKFQRQPWETELNEFQNLFGAELDNLDPLATIGRSDAIEPPSYQLESQLGTYIPRLKRPIEAVLQENVDFYKELQKKSKKHVRLETMVSPKTQKLRNLESFLLSDENLIASPSSVAQNLQPERLASFFQPLRKSTMECVTGSAASAIDCKRSNESIGGHRNEPGSQLRDFTPTSNYVGNLSQSTKANHPGEAHLSRESTRTLATHLMHPVTDEGGDRWLSSASDRNTSLLTKSADQIARSPQFDHQTSFHRQFGSDHLVMIASNSKLLDQSQAQQPRVQPEPYRGLIGNIGLKSNHREQCLDFTLEGPYTKVFAWIASLRMDAIRGSSRGLQSMMYNKVFFERFENSLLVMAISNGGVLRPSWAPKMPKEKWRVMGDVKLLVNRVWYLHSKILESFGTFLSDRYFKYEQIAMRNWLLDQIGSFEELGIAPDSAGVGYEQVEGQQLSQVQQMTLEALSFQKDGPLNNLRYAFVERDKQVVTESNVVLTKAAVYVVGAYYKSQNNIKWGCTFRSEENFLLFLSIIRWGYYVQHSKKHIQIMAREVVKSSIIPWKLDWINEIQPQLLVAKFNKILSKHTLKMVDPHIKLYNDPEKEDDHGINGKSKGRHQKDVFFLEKPFTKVFPWIASLGFNFRLKLSEEKFNKVYDKNFFESIYKMKLMKNEQFKTITDTRQEFRREISVLQCLVEVIWNMNEIILGNFGILLTDLNFETEQEFLKQWLNEQISSLQNCSGMKAVYLQQGFLSNKEKQISQLQQVLLDVLFFKNTSNYQEMSHAFIKQGIMVNKRSTCFTKAAIFVTGSYYQSLNTEKWQAVFNGEENFLNFLAILTQGFHSKYYSSLNTRVASIFKQYEIIPWNNEWKHGYMANTIYEQVFKQFCGKHEKDWVDRLVDMTGETKPKSAPQKIFTSGILEVDIPDNRVLAWIGSMLDGHEPLQKIAGSLSEKIKILAEELIQVSFSSKTSTNVCQLQIKKQLSRNFEEIIGAILQMSYMLLEGFVTSSFGPTLASEKLEFEAWVFQTFFNRNLFSLESTGPYDLTKEADQLGYLHYLIVEFMQNQDQLKIWRIMISNRGVKVRPNMCEYGMHEVKKMWAVINIIGYYYKTKNFSKWSRLFKQDEKFIIYLGMLRRKYGTQWQVFHTSIRVVRFDEDPGIIPWKNNLPSNSDVTFQMISSIEKLSFSRFTRLMEAQVQPKNHEQDRDHHRKKPSKNHKI